MKPAQTKVGLNDETVRAFIQAWGTSVKVVLITIFIIAFGAFSQRK